MEAFWSRQKIRDWIYKVIGEESAEAENPLPREGLNAAIDEAYAQVMLDAEWQRAEFDGLVELGTQQRLVNYPNGAVAGCVLAIAIALPGERWQPLIEGVLPVYAHSDLIESAGGEQWQAQCARPRQFQQRAQVELWPPTDQAGYWLKIRYRPRGDFADADTTLSAVDGMLIALLATSFYCTSPMKDLELAAVFERRYEKRLRKLRGALATGQRLPFIVQAGWSGETPAPIEARQEPFPSRTVINDNAEL